MSALGQKQTLGKVRPMSALPPKADIRRRNHHVRFVPKADIQFVGCVRGAFRGGKKSCSPLIL
jgi:hypothetical protein